MAKGFSFVLVTVVMIVMLVFGLLSLSSSAANMRLANKSANAQTTYYDVDAKGEKLVEQCAQAAKKAKQTAADFIANKGYAAKLPDDLYAGLKALCAKAQTDSDARQTLEKGMFFYYLNDELKKAGLTATLNQSALEKSLTGDGVVLTVDSTLKSELDPRCSLHVVLTYSAAGIPDSKRATWVYTVQTPEADGNDHLNVWQGN